MLNPDTVATLWWASLGILLVVTAVVALLLALVLRTARAIEGTVANIWTVGKLVANNTVHIPLLQDTNREASDILATAAQIVEGAAKIEQQVMSNK